MEQKKNTIKTDEAWSRLHARLEEEHLLPRTENGGIVHGKLLLKWGAVAAVFLGMIYCAALWMTPSPQKNARNLIMQQNSEKATLVKTLEDGSIVYLAQRSTLLYPEHFAADKREVNLQGEAFFDIAPQKEQSFLIETGKVRVEVLGTAFDVRSNESTSFSLSVQRGMVKVMLRQDGHTLLARAGETIFLQDGELHRGETVSSGYFDRYTKNIRFKDELLENVLRAVNRESAGTQVVTNSAVLNKKRLTVEFSDYSPESVAELICWTYGLNCVRRGNRLILEPAPAH